MVLLLSLRSSRPSLLVPPHHAPGLLELLLDPLLELGLSDEAGGSGGKGVAHQGNGTAEEGLVVGCGRLSEDLHDGLRGGGAGGEGAEDC